MPGEERVQTDAPDSPVAEEWPFDRDAHLFEESFRREYPILWLLTLVGPFVVTGLVLVALWLVNSGEYVRNLAGTGAATFFLFGRFVILTGHDPAISEAAGAFSAETLYAMVLYMDMMTALLLAVHVGVLLKVPWLGARLRGLMEDGRYILGAHPWMRRATFTAIVLFVMFPLAATGSVGGSIFGRMLGLSRLATFLGVTIGSLLGGGVMYFGARLINLYIDRDDPLVKIGGVVILAAFIIFLNMRYRKLKARSLAARQPPLGDKAAGFHSRPN